MVTEGVMINTYQKEMWKKLLKLCKNYGNPEENKRHSFVIYCNKMFFNK